VEKKATIGGEEPREDPVGLVLRADAFSQVVVFLKEHCISRRVEDLPEKLNQSVEHVVCKMTKSSNWVLLYESIEEELGFRARSAAHAIVASHAHAVESLLSEETSLEQERMCLPIWRSSALMTGLSKLRATTCDPQLRQARCELLRQASLEWCELEDFTAFLDEQLGSLELAIDSERGAHDGGHAHTPHVRDLGRLAFRNSCLLDSRVFRPLCLAAYALVHEVHQADAQHRDGMIELLEGLQAMLVSCDVYDDHLSASKCTKEMFVEHLVVPISAAIDSYTPWDIKGHDGHSSSDRRRRRGRLRC